MRRCMTWGWIATLLGVGVWRTVSELLEQQRQLSSSGLLADRVAWRRARSVQRALVSVDAAVSIGRVHVDDVDDIGLLDAAMRRAARTRFSVDHPYRQLPLAAGGQVDWVSVLLDDHDSPTYRYLRWLGLLVGFTSVGLTTVALVRPLSEPAPWFALSGLALAAVTLMLTRRS